jgi:hypothetical protein
MLVMAIWGALDISVATTTGTGIAFWAVVVTGGAAGMLVQGRLQSL